MIENPWILTDDEEELIVAHYCDECGGIIYEGDTYYECGGVICECCMEKMKKLA